AIRQPVAGERPQSPHGELVEPCGPTSRPYSAALADSAVSAGGDLAVLALPLRRGRATGGAFTRLILSFSTWRPSACRISNSKFFSPFTTSPGAGTWPARSNTRPP